MKKLIFFISLSMLILVGCEKRYERTIWVNPDVECCGVKDPLNNLEWLNNWYEDSSFNENNELNYLSYGFIFVFRNDSTLENFVVTRIYKYNTNWFQLYTCKGDLIDEGIYFDYNSEFANPDVLFSKSQMPLPPCQLCDNFFTTNTLIDTLSYFYTQQF